jgi:hypothetical protein
MSESDEIKTLKYVLFYRCEHGKNLKKELIAIINQSNYDLPSNISFDSKKILEFLEKPSSIDRSAAIAKLKDYQEVEYHRSVSVTQRESYNKDCKDKELLSRKVLIELDFKEKIIVGIGPREVTLTF